MEDFTAQIKTLTFLVADPSSSRKSVRSLLSQLGVKAAQVHAVDNIVDAKDIILKKNAEVIFADQTLLEGNCSELVGLQKQITRAGKIRAFFVLTSDDSNVVAGSSADEGVDAVLIKPFTMDTLKTGVLSVLQRKLQPTPYQRKLEEADAQLQAGNDEEALILFRKAKSLDDKSPLASSCEGVLLTGMGRLEEARKAFDEGFAKDANSYHCMMGLFDLLMLEKNHKGAYEIGKKIAKEHAVPFKKLPDLIRLSILNKKYEDALGFYKFSDGISQTTPLFSLQLSASLVVCGLYFFQQKDQAAAIDA